MYDQTEESGVCVFLTLWITNSITCHEIHPPPTLNAWGDCLQVLYHCPYKVTSNYTSKFLQMLSFMCMRIVSARRRIQVKFGQQLTYPHLSIDSTLMEKVFAKTHIYIYIYTLSWSLWIELFGLSFFSLCAFTFISWFCSSQLRAHPPRLFERLRQGDG